MQPQITTCSSYTSDPTLGSFVNMIVAGSDVNVHAFETVDKKIIGDIKGKSAFAYKFKREDISLANVSAVKIASDRAFDPAFCSNVLP
ncbi:hypothetical protein DPMN_108427 [Dreissena polymorpha]|uniref:Uncharacterized protein n=1 Tax=Dreissena polymorpha TaxID=45954 RepID=A0A9D4K8J4_DREPO|nr:hypothetical protein DPMN_108427 [Dreissena polymorpha]